MSQGNWLRVSRDQRCPICEKPDWCMVAEEGDAAICARIEDGSVKRCGEAGWLHRLDGGSPWQKRQRITTRIKIPATGETDFAEVVQRCQRQLEKRELIRLANELGVSADSLERLGVGFDREAYTFPMRDAEGNVIGVRIRRLDGRKLAIRGSRQGVFVPTDLPSSDPLLICEGPTDTAAALDLGFAAVGRPSCSGGTVFLVKLARGRDVVIVTDNDEPGLRGAVLLARRLVLHCPLVKIIKPPDGIKDLRQWLATGLTCNGMEQSIKTASAVKLHFDIKTKRRPHVRG